MITIVRKESDIKNGNMPVLQITGKSTDEKPTDVNNGSQFIEIDTGKLYFYDKETEQWIEF